MKTLDFCRCCLSKDLNSDSFEVYTDMLRATFVIQNKDGNESKLDNTSKNLLGSIVEEVQSGMDKEDSPGDVLVIEPNKISADDGEKGWICDKCILRLKDATDFKKQVVDSQEHIMKLLTMKDDKHIDDHDFKLELEEQDFDDSLSGDWSANECNWDVDEGEGNVFVIKMEKKVKSTKKVVRKSVQIELPLKSAKEVAVKKNGLKSVAAKSKHPLKGKKLPKLSQTHQNQCENTLKLIENSNMCPFKSFRTKFGCFACKSVFLDPSELRKHTSTHMDSKYLATRVKQMRGLTYRNVEITDLRCNLCSQSIEDLNSLLQHLEGHNISFQGKEHYLIPYRLKEGFSCVLCTQGFNTFTRLSIHMNGHYANNVCEICGRSFINRVSLRTHLSGMHKEKKCSLCSAVFYKQNALIRHMRKTHNMSKEKRYCVLCERSFPYSYLLEEHKIQEHGAKRPISKCSECGKTFNTPQNLRIHVRCVHMKERNYPCAICGMRFFTKCDQRRHERTHEDIRAFSCSYCDAKFKSKDSCRRHLRRQHGHVFGQETSKSVG